MLVERGIPPDRAVAEAVQWARARGHGMAGLDAGIDTIREAAELSPVRAVRETVSPWLWVFSLVGFGMAVLNTRRIATMYRSWREKHK